MPRTKVICEICQAESNTQHISDHKKIHATNTCETCKKVVKGRLRDHRCKPPEQPPHPQLSTYFDINKYGWREKCPSRFDHGIVDISSLDPATISLWSEELPTLNLAKDRPSEETVYATVLSTTRKSSNYQLSRNGEPIGFSDSGKANQYTASEIDDKKFELAATALYQSTTPASRETIYSILNVWPEDRSKILLEPPQQVQSSHHLCADKFDVSINATPEGLFVDLHDGTLLPLT